MGQLPPKAPTMGPNWPAATVQQQNMWVDEFLEFSSAKRSAHRRSPSDSIAFLEVPFAVADERRSSLSTHTFDRLDDEQLMSMFSDDIAATAAASSTLPATSSNTSSPSDHNSVNDEKLERSSPDQPQQQQRAYGEVESSCKSETTASPSLTPTTAAGDPIIDPKRVKRILANRQSAQRSRIRKLQYISELERSVTSLQNEVSALSPRVAFLAHQRLVLNVDNSSLKQTIAALAQDKIFQDAHQEALKKEIERLRQVYQHQNIKKMEDTQQQPHQQEQPEQTQICTDGDELLD